MIPVIKCLGVLLVEQNTAANHYFAYIIVLSKFFHHGLSGENSWKVLFSWMSVIPI